MADVEQIFSDAKFIESLGIELVASGPGWCETRVRVRPEFAQQHGFVHAGIIMTLADHTLGGAAATVVAADKDVITVDNTVSFLRPATGTELRCRGEVLRAGKNLVFAEATVRIDRNGDEAMVARAAGTLSVIDLGSR